MMDGLNKNSQKKKISHPIVVLYSAGTFFKNMPNAATFVTSLGACIWTVLENVTDLVAVVTGWLIAILCTISCYMP